MVIQEMAMSGLNLTKLRVLVVDDNALARDMIKFALSALNVHTVLTAEDGAKALQALRAFEPDLILADWMMTPVDGLEFVKRVRGDESNPFRFVPIIMITAFGEAWRVTEARDAGANEFVVKPFSARTLYSKIRSLIERPRSLVDGSGFAGPDRRRRAKDVGQDRRGVRPAAVPGSDGADGPQLARAS
jgi:CheY-like chemotaxis protein